MHRLTSLRRLIIAKCPRLEERCEQRMGEDWPKIAHVPNFQNGGDGNRIEWNASQTCQIYQNELRDEKQRLKAGKEKLEEQVKAMSAQPGSLPHPSAMLGTFSAQADAFHWLSQHGNSWHLL